MINFGNQPPQIAPVPPFTQGLGAGLVLRLTSLVHPNRLPILANLRNTGFNILNQHGRLSFSKNGTWVDAQSDVISHFGPLPAPTINTSGKILYNLTGVPHVHRLILRNFGKQMGVNGTIEIHLQNGNESLIIEFKYI